MNNPDFFVISDAWRKTEAFARAAQRGQLLSVYRASRTESRRRRAVQLLLAGRLDRGYDGVERDHLDRSFGLPYKARRNKPLNFVQKSANRIRNHYRVPVENALAHLKRFKVLVVGYLPRPSANLRWHFLTISGLHTFCKLNRLG